MARPLVHGTAGIDREECRPALRRDFATAVVTRTPGAFDARRGRYPHTLLERAVTR
ncbi:hypothetical protein [Streptomyces sp. AHA2]|uniref:hypothetical protein n=1 Tax=Streptomyces sp. AHA2 TaxID=3064526 RepID=UPI002FE1CD77